MSVFSGSYYNDEEEEEDSDQGFDFDLGTIKVHNPEEYQPELYDQNNSTCSGDKFINLKIRV